MDPAGSFISTRLCHSLDLHFRPPHMPVWMSNSQFAPQPIGQRPTTRFENPAQINLQLRQAQRAEQSASSSASSFDGQQNRARKRGHDEVDDEPSTPNEPTTPRDEEDENDPSDNVRLWEEGWRERYYKNKFNVDKKSVDEFRVQVAQHYARGLCWVLQYYYQGVPAWDWYVVLSLSMLLL